MSALMTTGPPSEGLKARRLPGGMVWAIAAGGLVLSYIVFGLLEGLGGGNVLVIVGTAFFFLLLIGLVSFVKEGARSARNRVATAAVYSAMTLALLPLVSIVIVLISRGTERLDGNFFTHSMAGI